MNPRLTISRILVACSPKSGSTYVARILAMYFDCDRVYPLDYWGRREQNLHWASIDEYLDRRFVLQMHVKPHEPNLDVIRRAALSVVYLWRNVGDVIVSLDDHIRKEDHRNPVVYIHDANSYCSLPAQERYRYLIQHALPWYISFYLSWRNVAPSIPAVRCRYEDMVTDPHAFFSGIFDALGTEPDPERLKTILDSKHDDTRFNHGTVGRSVALISETNRALLESLLLSHPEDLSELWRELPWVSQLRRCGKGLGSPLVESILIAK